jgi:hypothetical protein
MYGNSIPAGTVGGDLFEYINFQQRYYIDARRVAAPEFRKTPLGTASLRFSGLPAGGGVRFCPAPTKVLHLP